MNTKTGKWKDAPVEMMHEILERVKMCGRQLCDAKSYLFYPLVCRQIVPTFTKTRKLTRWWNSAKCAAAWKFTYLSPNWLVTIATVRSISKQTGSQRDPSRLPPGSHGYYDPGRLPYAGTRDTDLSRHVPISTFVAVCDHNPTTLQTDRRTGASHLVV